MFHCPKPRDHNRVQLILGSEYYRICPLTWVRKVSVSLRPLRHQWRRTRPVCFSTHFVISEADRSEGWPLVFMGCSLTGWRHILLERKKKGKMNFKNYATFEAPGIQCVFLFFFRFCFFCIVSMWCLRFPNSYPLCQRRLSFSFRHSPSFHSLTMKGNIFKAGFHFFSISFFPKPKQADISIYSVDRIHIIITRTEKKKSRMSCWQ